MTATIRTRIANTTRRLITRAAVWVLNTINPAPAVTSAETTPAGPVALPPTEAIEKAAEVEAHAADVARMAAKGKRDARKILGGLPAGTYGRVTVRWVGTAKTTVDLDAVRATYARLGLGEVPVKAVTPSLKVTLAPAVEQPAPALLAVAA